MTVRMKVCLVEDDALLGESLAERCRIEGLPFEWFRDAGAAQLALERRRFGVVLCDLRLPDMSGAELFAALEAKTRPPFIFMTGFGRRACMRSAPMPQWPASSRRSACRRRCARSKRCWSAWRKASSRC